MDQAVRRHNVVALDQSYPTQSDFLISRQPVKAWRWYFREVFPINPYFWREKDVPLAERGILGMILERDLALMTLIEIRDDQF